MFSLVDGGSSNKRHGNPVVLCHRSVLFPVHTGLQAHKCLSSSRAANTYTFTYLHSCAPYNDVSVNDGPHIRWWPHNIIIYVKKDKSVPLQAWSGPENSRKLRFRAFMTTVQGGGKVVSLTHRPHLPPSKFSWYSFLLEAESTAGP